MDNRLREKLVAKARENGEKHGKVAELDFGAGAEWMYNMLDKATIKISDNKHDKDSNPSFIERNPNVGFIIGFIIGFTLGTLIFI